VAVERDRHARGERTDQPYEAYAVDLELRGPWTTGFDDHCERG